MTLEELSEKLADLSPELRDSLSLEFGEAVLDIDPEALVSTAEELKRIGFRRLIMVTAVDYIERVVMIYRIQSSSLSASLSIKTRLSPRTPQIPSLVGVWPAADWQEREVFDLFGVNFVGHPDLRRILLPDDFEGHPLCKDYDDARLIRRPDYI